MYQHSGDSKTGFSDLRQNADGGFTIVGWSDNAVIEDEEEHDFEGSLLALRTYPPASNTAPGIAWARVFGREDLHDFDVEVFDQVAGGFAFGATGHFEAGSFLVATDQTGAVLWQKSVRGFAVSSMRAAAISTSSSGLLLGGLVDFGGAAIILTDGNGVTLYGKEYPQPDQQPDTLYPSEVSPAAVPTTESGALLIGASSISPNNLGLVVVKTDAALARGCHETAYAPPAGGSLDARSIVLKAGGTIVASDLEVLATPFDPLEGTFCPLQPPCVAPPARMTLWLPFDDIDQRSPPNSFNAAGGNIGVQHGNPAPALPSAGAAQALLPPRPAEQRQTPTESATPSSTGLVLSGRFQVDAQWQTAAGITGDGHAVGLSDDSGALWFFDSNNLELLVKVLDGCSLNGRFWFFAGGMTDLQVELKVTDTFTGAVSTYTNPAGTAFVAIQDTGAFATCP